MEGLFPPGTSRVRLTTRDGTFRVSVLCVWGGLVFGSGDDGGPVTVDGSPTVEGLGPQSLPGSRLCPLRHGRRVGVVG